MSNVNHQENTRQNIYVMYNFKETKANMTFVTALII